MSRHVTFGAIGAWLLLVSCTDPTGPGRSAPLTRLDSIVVDMLQWQEFMFTAYVPSSHNVPRTSTCAFDAAAATFVCPEATDHGLTLSLRFQLLDANGVPTGSYDALVVDAIRTVSHVQGRYANSGDAIAHVESHQDHTLRGLLGGDPVMSGTGSKSQDWTLREETVAGSSDQVITDLALPRFTPIEGSWIPRSGTIRVHRQDLNDPTRTAETVLTFLGTVVARLRQIIDGVTQDCTWDFTPRDPEAGNGITCEPPGR